MLVGTPDKGIPAKRRERISNVPASITVVVTADLSARMVEYRYESDQEKTAVPEQGILTFRSSDASVDLYSADQRLTSEQAHQLVRSLYSLPSCRPTWHPRQPRRSRSRFYVFNSSAMGFRRPRRLATSAKS